MNEATPTPPATETIGPKEIGAQMAALREQFKLSQQEVSERLHIRTRYVSAIEEGRYELMPGKVYARGYVQTYAEFLGLNPEKVIAQCFAGEAPANAQPIPPIAAARYTSPAARSGISTSRPSAWRGYAVFGALALGLVLVVSQFLGHGSDASKQEEATVAPVPEAMLASVRTMVMPQPENYECLTEDAYLTCFAADDTMHLMSHVDEDRFWYGGAIDASMLEQATIVKTEDVAAVVADKPAVADKPMAEDKSAAENPDSPAVATVPAAPAAAQADDGQNSTPPHDE